MSHDTSKHCHSEKKKCIKCVKGPKGNDGPEGKQGPPGEGITSNIRYIIVTPQPESEPIFPDLTYNIIAVDTSNLPATLSVGAPTSPGFWTFKLLHQHGLSAYLNMISGGTFELSPSNPNVLLYWDGFLWHILDNPADISSFYPNSNNVAQVIPLTTANSFGSGGTSNQDIAISADGNTIAVGNISDQVSVGAVFIFVRSAGSWTQEAKLVGTGGTVILQGGSIALSADGNTVAFGSSYTSGPGAVWVFTRAAGVWTQETATPLLGSDDDLSVSLRQGVSLSADGNTLAFGSFVHNSNIGATWVFTRFAGVWTQEGSSIVGTGYTSASRQGSATSLSADGNTLAVGGRSNNLFRGAVWIFTRLAGVWTQQGSLLTQPSPIVGDQFGYSVSLSHDGNTLGIISRVGDSAWVFIRNNGVWLVQSGKLYPNDSVGQAGLKTGRLTSDGNTFVLGGYNNSSDPGAIWVFRRINGSWTQFGSKLLVSIAGSEKLGSTVAVSSDGSVMASAVVDTPNQAVVFQ